MGLLTKLLGVGLKTTGKIVITAHKPFSAGIKKEIARGIERYTCNMAYDIMTNHLTHVIETNEENINSNICLDERVIKRNSVPKISQFQNVKFRMRKVNAIIYGDKISLNWEQKEGNIFERKLVKKYEEIMFDYIDSYNYIPLISYFFKRVKIQLIDANDAVFLKFKEKNEAYNFMSCFIDAFFGVTFNDVKISDSSNYKLLYKSKIKILKKVIKEVC